MRKYKKIENYGVIGNLDTCALVSNEGSIDWCCFPHDESPSIFASILDIHKGGYFRIAPLQNFSSVQNYFDKTNVLQTKFHTSIGNGTLTDFMPVKYVEKGMEMHQAILRKIACDSGRINFHLEFAPRFDFSREQTEFRGFKNGIAVDGIDSDKSLFLFGPSEFEVKPNMAIAEYSLKQNESLWFVLRYNSDQLTENVECEEILKRTLDYWQKWSHECEDLEVCIFQGKFHDLAIRSGLILKLLINQEEGSIAAASTTSIPEHIGGVRNWDYRYNWVRDASFAIQAFYHLGHTEEAKSHLAWFTKICKQHLDPSDIQPVYGMNGETELPEQEIYNLEGYKKSRPVRVGNNAYLQKQLDVYGELINAFYETTRYGKELTERDWDFVLKVVNHVCQIWKIKDSGIWEARGKPKDYVYSKVMCWVALDRGIKIANAKNVDAPFDLWSKTKDEIYIEILKRGFSNKLNSFVQFYDSEELDASCLLIPIVGFLPFEDSRIQGTIDAVLKYLTTEKKLVYRYRNDDGVHGDEGAFLLCSFWLTKSLALSGRIDEAENILDNLVNFVSPTGILSEEVNIATGELLGNFPQAFSHIGLINSIIYLSKAKGSKHGGPAPMGTE